MRKAHYFTRRMKLATRLSSFCLKTRLLVTEVFEKKIKSYCLQSLHFFEWIDENVYLFHWCSYLA